MTYHKLTDDGKILTTLQRFFAYSMGLLAVIILIRLYETFVAGYFYEFPDGSWKVEMSGLRYDFVFFLKISAFIFIPFVILHLIKPLFSKILYIILAVLITSATLALIGYFGRTSILMGSDIFAYSRDEIEHTVGASGALNVWSMMPFVFLIPVAIFIIIFSQKINPKRTFSVLFSAIVFISLFVSFTTVPKPTKYKSEYNSFLANNKLSFFVTQSVAYFEKIKGDENLLQTMDVNQMFKNIDTTTFKYISNEYPFLRKDESKDVLGSFFNTSEKLPNFVFIITESLGRAYCGTNAYLGSFTPYLDSLMQQGLYWDNFLSTAGRTFSVMPSMFGSVPFGEKGFAEMGQSMPQCNSFVSLLKKYGYTSTFYYGGSAHFDNMDEFFMRQKIDKIVDDKNFGEGYTKLPAKGNGFSWGYGDREIFRKFLSNSQTQQDKPRIDIILTIAMHDPFLLPNQSAYNQKFDERLTKLGLSEEQKKYNRRYKAQFETVLYYDDALRYLFTQYAKRADFANTIFIITGDHRMPEIPIRTQLDRFHVPFVIYSPLLKNAKKFSSVSTQFDVTPSLLAYLRENYKMTFPKYVTWMGSGLDVETKYRNIHSYPLMRNKNELMDFIDKEYFLSGTTLYRVMPDMNIIESVDQNILRGVQQKFEIFNEKNIYACKKNRLLPDSLAFAK